MKLEERYELRAKIFDLAAQFDAELVPATDLTQWLFDNERFMSHPASSKPTKHHHWKGGLLQHTYEVITTALALVEHYPQYEISRTELFLSALYHDSGKMFDYDPMSARPGWHGNQHKRRIHHIPRSVIIWTRALDSVEPNPWFRTRYEDAVVHNILSHHGLREWGSPVSPDTREAWILHLADQVSARLEDVGRSGHVHAIDKPRDGAVS